MATAIPKELLDAPLPDHTQLPDSDGAIVENTQELPQAILLTDTLMPVLRRRHPDGQFFVGSNSGIYWRLTDPPLRGAVAPDWYYVPGVPPALEGQFRRSYVLWKELISPLVVLEFVSGDGSEERDRTPWEGKFWIYEQAIRAPYYGIYEVDPGRVELYRLAAGAYEPVEANGRGHYPIPQLGVELGLWQGSYFGTALPWLRWWDDHGNLLPTSQEIIEREHRRAEEEHRRAEEEHRRAEALAARLRALGVDPDQVATGGSD